MNTQLPSYRLPTWKIVAVAGSVIGGAICAGAGIYLLGKQSPAVADMQPWLEVIAHGLGVYMSGVGIAVAAAAIGRAAA